MQFKSITTIAVLLLMVASLLVAGCVTSNDPGSIASKQPTTTPTATPTKSPSQPTVTPSGSTNQEVAYADKLTAYFKERYEADKAIVVKPFVLDSALSKPGIPAYTAVVKDGSSKLEVWTHNLTYIFYSDRELARSGFEQAKTKATSQGYGNAIKGDNYWIGIIGTWSEAVGTKEAAIHVCQPNNLCGEDFWLTFSEDFVVSTDYKNRIE